MKAKTLLFFAIAIQLSINSIAQSTIRISGTTSKAKKVYLFDYGKKEPRLSAPIKDGEFSFTVPSCGNLPQIAYIAISEEDENKSVIVIDDEDVNVDLDYDTRSGSKNNVILDEFNTYYKDFVKWKLSVLEALYKTKDAQLYKELRKQIPDKTDPIKIIYQINKFSIIGLYILKCMVPSSINPELFTEKDLGTTLENLDLRYENSALVKDVRNKMYSMMVHTPGYSFIDLCLNGVDGKKHWLNEWCGKGNYVLVDFWASWCGPCMGEMPNLIQNYAKYHEKGFEIVGVSLDDNSNSWKNCVKKNQMAWPQLSDLKGWQSGVCKTYAITAIPANILVDPDGKVVKVNLRGNELTNTLQEIFDNNELITTDNATRNNSLNSDEREIHKKTDGQGGIVEQNPSFPGGMDCLKEWLAENVKYPTNARAEQVQGRVIVDFIVDKDGSIVNPSIIRSVHPDLDAEALRVVSAMPKWTPGVQKGKSVRVRFSLPITFIINAEPINEDQNSNQTTTYGELLETLGPKYISWNEAKNYEKKGSKMWEDEWKHQVTEIVKSVLYGSFPDYPELQLNNDANRIITDFEYANAFHFNIIAAKELQDYAKYVEIQMREFMKWRGLSHKFSTGVSELEDILKSANYISNRPAISKSLFRIAEGVFTEDFGTTGLFLNVNTVLNIYKEYYFCFDMARAIYPFVAKGFIDRKKLVELKNNKNGDMAAYIDNVLATANTNVINLVTNNFVLWIKSNVPELNRNIIRALRDHSVFKDDVRIFRQ